MNENIPLQTELLKKGSFVSVNGLMYQVKFVDKKTGEVRMRFTGFAPTVTQPGIAVVEEEAKDGDN